MTDLSITLVCERILVLHINRSSSDFDGSAFRASKVNVFKTCITQIQHLNPIHFKLERVSSLILSNKYKKSKDLI